MSARTEPDFFERLYRDADDPWGFETSPYEAAKYERTLAAIGDRRPLRALELGCSIGVFTERLADRCDRVVAIEPAPTALAAARKRLAGRDNVELVEAAVPEGLPDGPFDLVVCSEVLYYLAAELQLETLRGIESRLAPGGLLVAVHWRPAAASHRATGDEVHAALAAQTDLLHVHGERHDRYLLDSFTRR